MPEALSCRCPRVASQGLASRRISIDESARGKLHVAELFRVKHRLDAANLALNMKGWW
jgi:hypothetical protein